MQNKVGDMRTKIIVAAFAGAVIMLNLAALGMALMGGIWWVTWTMPDFSLAVVMKFVRAWVAMWVILSVVFFLMSLND